MTPLAVTVRNVVGDGRRVVRRRVGRIAVVLAAGDQHDDRVAAGAVGRRVGGHRRDRRGPRVVERVADRTVVVGPRRRAGRNQAGASPTRAADDRQRSTAGGVGRRRDHTAPPPQRVSCE